jgi:metal transporter CNNM
MNALAYETLPIFLGALVPSWVTILLSTTLILVFGEIIPSGVFMGPNQLFLGNLMVPAMRFFLWLFYPVVKPLAALLDYLTETDGAPAEVYNRGELSALVRIQHETLRGARMTGVLKKERSKHQIWSSLRAEMMERVGEVVDDSADHEEVAPAIEQFTPPLVKREVDMVEGALKLKTHLAMDVYTPDIHVYSVPDDLILSQSNITVMYSHGYSRVPVYRPNKSDPNDQSAVMGFLITRQLMLIDWEDNREISTLPLQRPKCVSPRMNLVDLFEILQTDGPLMTFVCARPDLANKALAAELPIPAKAGFMGIVTFLDIMEFILQDRIYDESDIRHRDRAVATLLRWAGSTVLSFLRKSNARRKRQRGGSILVVAKTTAGETTPLLSSGSSYTSTQEGQNGNGELEYSYV